MGQQQTFKIGFFYAAVFSLLYIGLEGTEPQKLDSGSSQKIVSF
jgi:hypothetical protein